jgi:hypothetical protein
MNPYFVSRAPTRAIGKQEQDMGNQKEETSPSGVPIYRYGESNKDWQPPSHEDDSAEQIEQHIRKHVGNIETVYHEIVSDLVHIDIHFVMPSTPTGFSTLVTSGMSSRPMLTPEGAKGYEYAELLVCLPLEWPLSQEDFKDERNYWPIRALKYLARFPHSYDTWLWWGHTIPNGNPPEPFADNTRLCGMILSSPILLPEEFFELEVNASKTIRFFNLLPLYAEEIDFKLQKGTDGLFDLLDKNRVTPLINIDRPNVCKKSRWSFRSKS